MTRTATIRTAVVVLTLLAGCGGASTGGKSGGSNSIEAELGFDTNGQQQRQRLVEEKIRGCMKGRGFEYFAVDPVVQRSALVGGNLTDEEFTSQYGYGITTLIDKRNNSDPNASVRSALSATDRAAYDAALTGENRSATFTAALDTGDFSTLGGCTKSAVEAVFGGTEMVTTLQSKLDDLDRRIDSDPRMVAALAKWATCMTAAGYPGNTASEDVDATLLTRLTDIVGPLAMFDPEHRPAYDSGALAELQRLEVAMVTADVACEDKHVAPVDERVRAEYEAAFRTDNADLVAQAGQVATT